MIDLTPILEALIGLVAALVSLYLIPWLRARTTAEQQAHIRAAVEVAVFAAEKVYGAGRGDEKLTYALAKLESMGIDIDEERVGAMIEAAIKQMEIAEGEKGA